MLRSYLTPQEYRQLQAARLEAKATDAPGAVGEVYEPLPWQVEPYRDAHALKIPILLLTGSAGGGKSRLAAEIVHRFMLTASRPATGLVLRKAREFAGKSIVPFMRYAVIGNDRRVEYKKGDMTFEYDNGSHLYVGGMKDDMQREAIRSIGSDGALDIVWMEEANAFTEEDFSELLGRMRGRAHDYAQIVLTTNPDAPNHWINRRLIIGQQAQVYYSGAKDNRYNPPWYADNLEMMTGTLYERLVLGHWVQAEGAILDNFSVKPGDNVTEEAEYNLAKGSIFWGGDDGYALGGGTGTESYHPRAVVLAQRNHLGGVDVFAEYEKAGVYDHHMTIDDISQWGYPKPEAAAIDSAAPMWIATLYSDYDIYAVGATHPVSEGIKLLRQMICDGRGVRLIRIHPRCKRLIACLQSYRYSEHSTAKGGEPTPLKIDDHLPDALRYLVWILSGS